ncbi:ankyrin repeat-containing domain protein [Baffinella frigidus]|nr:ankyrin repeat-containing domain protein [Cryptophyta sp. CCMP2293]
MPFRKKCLQRMGREFDRLVDTAAASSLDTMVHNLADWVKRTQQCSGVHAKHPLSQRRSKQLLDAITYEWYAVDAPSKIKMLINSHGADINWRQDSPYAWGLLARTVFVGMNEAAIVLLSHGADPNANGFWGMNTFVFAVHNNYIDVVKSMRLHGANLWQSNQDGETAMVSAVRGAYFELVEFFLNEGVCPNWYDMTDKKTLLHHAVCNASDGSTDVLRLLLAAGANPHSRCAGSTPLQTLSDFKKRRLVSAWMDRREEALFKRIVDLNASILSHHMDNTCDDWAVAVCMSTHDRLGSDNCSLHELAAEPGLLQMIMANVCNDFFDPAYPATPLCPTAVYKTVDVSSV